MRQKFIVPFVILFCLIGASLIFAQQKAVPPSKDLPVVEDTEDKNLIFPFSGKWMPDEDPLMIGAKNFKTLTNFRYTDTALEGVNGYSKINTTALSSYPKIRNGFQLKKDKPAESHVLVQAFNSGVTASVVYQNTTAIPNQGDFSATVVHTDDSGVSNGRFSQGPRGTVIYCNGKESLIWGGSEASLGAFITSTAAITDSVTNPKDYTEKVNNTLSSEDQIALIGGGNDSATILLLHMDGGSGETNFADSSTDARTMTAGGNVATNTDQAVFGSASGEFDGSGDYLSAADDADFNFGTGTLTIDMRVRFDTTTGIHSLYMQKDATGGDHIALFMDHEEGKLHFQVIDTGTDVINEAVTWAPTADTWYHLALIRGWGGGANAWAITVNGTAIHTFTDSGTMPDHDQVVLIGGNVGTTYAFDYTGRHSAISWENEAAVSTVASKFGNASILFDGTDDYIYLANSADFDISGVTNSTCDFWVKHADHVGQETYVNHASDGSNYWDIRNLSGTGLQFVVATAGVVRYTLTADLGGTDGIADTDWHHIAVVKLGSDFGIYVDGIQYAYQSNANLYDINGNLYIGTALGGAPFSGYIDGVRITNNNVFSAAPNVGLTNTITIPTAPYSTSANTLLALRADTYDLDGFIDELRVKKASAAWSANFTIPARAYSTNALYWVVGSTRPLQGIKAYVKNVNTESGATVTGTTWNGYSWTTLTNLTDNTSGLEQTGTITFDSTVDVSLPKFLNGYYLYFYQFVLSSGSADLYYVTVDAPFQDIIDIWDGVDRQAITFQASRSTIYEDYTLDVAELDSAYYDIGATLGGLTSADHIIAMFDDRTTAIKWTMIGGKTNAAASIATVYYWDGSQWAATANLVDLTLNSGATSTLSQTGVMSWTPPSIETEFQRELFGITGYAYKITFSGTLTDGTAHAGTSADLVTGIPAQLPVKPFKFSAIYKNRVMLGGFTESAEGNRIDFSLTNAPDVYNGEETSNGGIRSLYFGGEEELTAAVQLYNRFGSNIFATLVVFKDTETYLLTGDSPEDFKIYPLSLNTGCPAPLTIATAELGYEIAQEAQRNVVMWLSNTGPMMLDGAVFVPLKGVEKYFDPADSDYINTSYYDSARGWYDSDYREYNLVIPSGSGQTTNDIWIVYDLVRKKWYRKDPGSSAAIPQSAWQVVDTNGKRYIYGGLDTGYMMRLENSAAWDSTAITQTVETGDFFPTENPWDKTLIRRVKLIAKGITEDTNLVATHYTDTATSGTTAITLDLNGSNRVVKDTDPTNLFGWSHRLKFEGSTSTETKGIQPLMWGIQYRRERLDQ